MNLKFIQLGCAIAISSHSFAVAIPTKAEPELPELLFPQVSNPINNNNLPEPQSEGLRLLFGTVPELLAQDPAQNPEIAQITTIEIVPSDRGVTLILETAQGEGLAGTVSTVDNSLILNIPNAQLEDETFLEENPIEGIARVEALVPSPDRVRVIITGVDSPPGGEILQDLSGLTLGITLEGATPEGATTVADPSGGLRVVVTAEKRPDDVQNIPISITALTAEDIEDADITSFEQIAGATPNFTTYTPGRNFVLYSVRGLSNFNFLSRDPVAFYIDDIPYDFTGFLDLDLMDLERVEVLRGPQSTLYGRFAEAGVINVVTRQPSNVPEYNVITGFGNLTSPDVRASFSGPIVPDEWFFRLSGNFSRRDGFLVNTITDEDVDFESGGGGRAQLLWTPSENWEVSFNAAFNLYRDGTPPISRPDLGQDPSETDLNEIGFNDLGTDTQSIKVTYENSDLRFTSISGRRFSDQEFQNDSDGTAIDGIIQFSNVDSTVLTQEFRVQPANDDGRLTWLAGAYFEDRDFSVDGEGFTFGADFLGPFTTVTTAAIDEDTYAVFGQASYRPIEPLTLTAGLRYEIFNSKLENAITENIIGGSTFPGGEFFTNENNNGTELLPRFAAEYQVTPNLMIYGSAARSYRAQGVNFRATVPGQLFFDEEQSWTFEVGARSSWFNDRLIANLTLFHNPISNFQVPATDVATGLFGFVDNADVTINGLELELRSRPIQGLDLIAGLGYLDAEYTDFVDPILGNFNGNQLPFSPDYTFNLAAQYRALNGIVGRFEAQGFGTTFFNDENNLSQSPYVLFNARLGYEFQEGQGIYLFANNLFDFRAKVTEASFFGGTLVTATYNAPRTFGVQYRASF